MSFFSLLFSKCHFPRLSRIPRFSRKIRNAENFGPYIKSISSHSQCVQTYASHMCIKVSQMSPLFMCPCLIIKPTVAVFFDTVLDPVPETTFIS